MVFVYTRCPNVLNKVHETETLITRHFEIINQPKEAQEKLKRKTQPKGK